MDRAERSGNRWSGRIASAILNGLAAYVGGVIGSLVLFVVLGLNVVGTFAFTTVPLDAGVGFAFYGGHFVSVTSSAGGSINFALDAASQGALYVLVVVVVLLASGYDAATAEGVPAELGDRAIAGASIVAGYLPLAVLGAVLFEWSTTVGSGVAGQSETVAYSLPLVPSVLLAGVAFPVVLGGIGGVVAAQLE
jgi:hypothetical protein